MGTKMWDAELDCPAIQKTSVVQATLNQKVLNMSENRAKRKEHLGLLTEIT